MVSPSSRRSCMRLSMDRKFQIDSIISCLVVGPQVPVTRTLSPTPFRYLLMRNMPCIWTQICDLFVRYMPVNLMLTGKGSDGDPRERTMMLQLMYSRWRQRHHPRGSIFSHALPQASQWVSLDGAKGFRMKIELTAGGLIRGLMAQDPINVRCEKS